LMRIIGTYDARPHLYSTEKNVTGICTGDWHIADKYAPQPDQACTKEGQTIKPSWVQKEIKKGLIKYLKQIGHVNVLIVNGDVTEGKQLKSFGVPVSDSDTDTQVEWARQFYEETFYKYNTPDYVLVTMGTPYHVSVGIGGNLDYQFADKISNMSNVIFGYPNLGFYLGKEKMLWDVRHRVSIAQVNKLMPMEKTFRMFYHECVENNTEVPNVVGRSHNHSVAVEPRNFSTGKNKFYGWHAPCLKASDIYGEQLSYPSSPQMGVLSFTQSGRVLGGEYHCIELPSRKTQKI